MTSATDDAIKTTTSAHTLLAAPRSRSGLVQFLLSTPLHNRKPWLFAGSERGAARAAAMSTLITSARAQRCQFVGLADSRDAPVRADHPVEQPRRNLQPPMQWLARKGAAEDRHVTLLDHLMDKDLPLSPGMRWIKKLALNINPAGVPWSSCTTRCDRIIFGLHTPGRQMQSCGRLRNPAQLRRQPQP